MDRWCSWPVSPVREAHERTRRINTPAHIIVTKGYIYVLLLKNGKTYLGSTNNLSRRLEEHKKGRVCQTKNKLPFIVILTQEFNSLQEAREKEQFHKTSWGRRKLKKLINPTIKNIKDHGSVV